jgi:hypothetical protein
MTTNNGLAKMWKEVIVACPGIFLQEPTKPISIKIDGVPAGIRTGDFLYTPEVLPLEPTCTV